MVDLKRSVKESIKSVVAIAGMQIRKIGPDTKPYALKRLKDAGIAPRVVIDVGVHTEGTPELYETFPDAKFLLIEPAEEFAPAIRKIIAPLKDAELIIAAASNEVGTGTLRITRDKYVHTSLADAGDTIDHAGKHFDQDYVEVPLITIDGLCEERGLTGPFLLKVDVDGVDLQVLQGSTKMLAQTDVVIVEAPVDRLLERANFLKENGFFLWGIVEPLYFGDTLWQVDLVFVSDRFTQDAKVRPWASADFKFT